MLRDDMPADRPALGHYRARLAQRALLARLDAITVGIWSGRDWRRVATDLESLAVHLRELTLPDVDEVGDAA